VRVLANILIGLGIFFLVVIGLVSWLAISRSQFRKEQSPFVQTFVTDLARRWEVADVYDRLANPFIEQAGTPQGQQLLHQFKQLGAFKSLRDLELQSYKTSTSGKIGNFSFKGTFENGEAAVGITLIQENGAVHVLSFYLTSPELKERAPKFQASSTPPGRLRLA